jgi:poly-gamma-glutamate capsule biosynthesis protein CapA/YwtB (metallophosphatase superfamily)
VTGAVRTLAGVSLPRRLVAVGVALLAALPAVSCAAPDDPDALPVPARVTAAPDGAADADVTLAFAGDVHFTGRTAALLEHPDTAFGPITPLLAGADLAMVNLETAVTDRGTPQPKQYHFRAPAAAFQAVRAAGIDAVTLANNHTLDYGRQGLLDTLDAAAASHTPVVGAGRDAAEAWKPWMTEVKGIRIAVIGISQVWELASTWTATAGRPGIAHAGDATRSLAAVRAARRQADVVVVLMHWGREGRACPVAEQTSFARRLAAAGADIIVGSHAHTLQGTGWLGSTYVAYGLANFLWWENSYSTETGVLRITLHDRAVSSSRFFPATVSGTGQPVPEGTAVANRRLRRLADLRGCAGLSAAPGPAPSTSP